MWSAYKYAHIYMHLICFGLDLKQKMLDIQNHGQNVFNVAYSGAQSSREGQLGKLPLLLWEEVIWTVDDPACSCYTDNQRWLLCIMPLS